MTASLLRELGLSRGAPYEPERLNERVARFVDSLKRTGPLRGAGVGDAAIR